jgi:LytS/YehU family sensor histidine kinase
MMPPLLLQPLVENAVRHGIAQLVEGGSVRLEAERRGERIRIAVENAYDPESPARGGRGIGLRNVRQRLATSYGNEARVELQKSNNVFRVELTFPAQSQEAAGGGSDR